jgi:hypothetical protein
MRLRRLMTNSPFSTDYIEQKFETGSIVEETAQSQKDISLSNADSRKIAETSGKFCDGDSSRLLHRDRAQLEE